MKARRNGGGAWALFLAFVAVAALAADGARAQSRTTQLLIERMEAIEQRLNRLEGSASGSEMLTQPAAPSQTPSRAAEVEVRLGQLEQAIRQLTGRAEESDHRTRQLAERLEQAVADFEARLAALEARLAAGAPPPAADAAAAGPAPADVGTPPAAAEAAPAGAALPPGTPNEQYNFAIGLVRQGAYAEAERAFRAFLEQHPQGELSPNAQYWLGETYYVRQMYEEAARAFLTGYETYRDSGKASDSLLKLGVSLKHLGQKAEACATFGELLNSLPPNERRLRPTAERERRDSGCT